MPGIKDWVVKASKDLKAARKLVKDDDDTLDLAAYHTQQVAEKILKAYIIFKQEPVTRTHDVIRLLKECIKHDSTFDLLREDVEILYPFAIYVRYPDDRFNIDREEALEAIKVAEKILKFVKARLGPAGKSPQLRLFD